jgi:ABC-2 type transport system ATP-binding protein
LIHLFGRLRGVSDFSYADEIAERIDAQFDRPMRRLSRGNKQKIGIVQAIFHQPDVIILDEPTGGLDPLVQETFLTILEESRERGQTILFSSHVLAEIERVADRVGIIRHAELVAVENPHVLTGRA